MTEEKILKILKDTDFIHESSSDLEKQVAEYLKNCCTEMGVEAHLEPFPVQMSTVSQASLSADGKEIPCKGFRLCGSGTIEAPFCYLPNTDPASLYQAKGKIVLLDTGMGHFLYEDLLKAGIAGFITYNGNIFYPDHDIDQKELRPYVSLGKKLLGVNIHATDAAALVAAEPKTVRITVEQTEFNGESRNVVAEIPGKTDEWLIITAHYDTTPLSRGQYDNMSGSIGVLGVLEALAATAPHRYGLRFVLCGSEERGLLGSKAYTAFHASELSKIALDINMDMIGTITGKFNAVVSAEEKLVHYLQYMAAMQGWGLDARLGVYASDSTPFADHGVPALTFARMAPASQSNIHSRYDTAAVLSAKQMKKDIDFITAFTASMADACICPVGRTMPDKIKEDLDVYMNRKRKKEN